MSLNLSTLQISLSFAVLVLIGIVLLRSVYLALSDLITAFDESIPWKIFLNDPDEVAIGNPDLSNSANVSMSL